LKEKSTQSTGVGIAVKILQERYPRAKIIYASATSISEPSHFLYMERLGLWGHNTSFSTFNDFNKALTERYSNQFVVDQ